VAERFLPILMRILERDPHGLRNVESIFETG